MRKLFTLSIAVLLSVFSINAQYVMKVTLKNGQEKEFDTSEIENIIWPENEDAPETHEWVDLGLPSGTKWATCNVGASSPEEYGDYYAWGETETKSVYSEVSYKYYAGTDTDGDGWIDRDFNVINIGSEISGIQYDVAHVQWGGNWRMPTLAQCQELIECCSSSWTSVNGVNGRKFVGPNGNSIFLPAAGYRWYDYLDYAGSGGNYWSGTLDDDSVRYASGLYFGSGGLDRGSYHRLGGLSVRPVCP